MKHQPRHHMTRHSKRMLIAGSVLLVGAALLAHNARHHQPSTRADSANNSSTAATPEVGGAKCHMRGDLPDSNCTPGAVDPAVTEANVARTICVRGYTSTVRPPASYTTTIKLQQMQDYGFTDSPRLHEEDHLISLELGGSPKDPANLWPQPGISPNSKDKIENFLHAAICAGQISLSDAQHRIATDWVHAEDGLSN